MPSTKLNFFQIFKFFFSSLEINLQFDEKCKNVTSIPDKKYQKNQVANI